MRSSTLRRTGRRKEKYFPLTGGLDLVTPALQLKPGNMIVCNNYEPEVNGGYRRILGYERFSGRPSPSEAEYYTIEFDQGFTSTGRGITQGDVMQSAAPAYGYALIDEILYSGSRVGGDAAGIVPYSALPPLSHTFAIGDQVASPQGGLVNVTVATETDKAPTMPQHTDWKYLSGERARTVIFAPAGSGTIRGIHVMPNGDVYCVRDNAGATAAVMFKATPTGWVAQVFGHTIGFASGTAEFLEQETVTGGVSGATATTERVVLTSGTWGTTAAGYLVVSGASGTFDGTEAISSAAGAATSNTANVLITLPAGGRYEFVNHNFGGHTSTERAYGVNGVGTAFEWDGSVFAPVITGMTTDTPSHIEVHRNHLFLAFPGGSLQNSAVGTPLSWSAILGASEIGLGEEITSIESLVDDTMLVVGRDRTFILYGVDNTDWSLRIFSRQTGSVEWTLQTLGKVYHLDDVGVSTLFTAREFGNFLSSTISNAVQPFLDLKRSLAISSCIIRGKNQYRLFFSDGTGLIFTFNKDRLIGISTIEFDTQVSVVVSGEDALGNEVVYFGSTDGMVYQMEKGTSLDGAEMSSWLKTAYHHYGSPGSKKRFRKATPEFDIDQSATILVTPEYSYGSSGISQQVPTSSYLEGGGVDWGSIANWGEFFWSAEVIPTSHVRLDGHGENMGLHFFSKSDREQSHAIHGVTIQYSLRGVAR